MVEIEVVGLEKDNKDSMWVFEVELAHNCELGLDSSNLCQDTQA